MLEKLIDGAHELVDKIIFPDPISASWEDIYFN